MGSTVFGRRRTLLGLAAVSLLVLSGCGGEDTPDTETEATEDTDGGATDAATEDVESPPEGESADAGDEAAAEVELDPVTLRIGTFDEGSAWYQYGATLSEVLANELPEGSSVQVQPFAGGVGNPQLVQSGEVDVAFSFSVNSLWAYEGRIAYEEEHDKLRGLVGGLDAYYLGLVARDGLEAETFADVVENQLPINLYTLVPGSQGEQATQLLLEAYGVSYEDIESWGGSVEHTTFDVITSEFQNGNVDLMIHNITEGHPAVTQIAVQSDIKLLEIDPDQSQALQDEYGMRELTLPGGTFEGQEDDVPTVGWSTGLIASSEMSEDLAYVVTRAWNENADTFAEAHGSLAAFDPQTAADEQLVGVPLHPGAERYYEEAGLLTQ